MANSFLTPNMALTVPIVTLEPGPDWANDINASLQRIDQHDHSSGNGVQVTPNGINISKDISFNSHNATDLRTARFTPQPAILDIINTPNDIGALYTVGTNLYYNNATGFPVQITNGNSVAGGAGTISGLPSPGASAAYNSLTKTFIFEQAPGVGANLDGATLILRYPGSYPTPTGDWIQLRVPSSFTGTLALTLPFSLPAQLNAMTLAPTGAIGDISFDQIVLPRADQIGQTMTPVGANAVANTRTRPVGTPASVGGIALSASSGNFITTSTVPVDITNMSLRIATSGRPIIIGLISDGTFPSSIYTTNINSCFLLLRRAPFSGSPIYQDVMSTLFSSDGGLFIPLSSFWYLDAQPMGDYLYKLQGFTNGGGVQLGVGFAKLVAYEL